jgi:hypothetical protein
MRYLSGIPQEVQARHSAGFRRVHAYGQERIIDFSYQNPYIVGADRRDETSGEAAT